MSQVTRFNGDYNITGVDPSGNVVVSASTLLVNGNLVVTGVSSSIVSTNTQISDNIIILNKGELSNGVSHSTAGIDIDRGGLTTASIYWNESPTPTIQGGTAAPRWEITDSLGVFHPIATVATFSVMADVVPSLGGNLDTRNNKIFNSRGNTVSFSNSISVLNSVNAPSAVAGYNTIYMQPPSGGGSGVYVVNSTTRGDELITKSKAIVFALIM